MLFRSRSAGVRADGVLGPVTRMAVEKKLGLRGDGEWDREDISAIQRQLNRGEW